VVVAYHIYVTHTQPFQPVYMILRTETPCKMYPLVARRRSGRCILRPCVHHQTADVDVHREWVRFSSTGSRALTQNPHETMHKLNTKQVITRPRTRLASLSLGNTGALSNNNSSLGSTLSVRSFSTTDGPFRHIKPRFVDRKRRYESVLVTASVKTLMQAAESCISDPLKKRSTGFWEILVKRSIASIPLMNQLELGLIGRALDVCEEYGPSHLPKLRKEFAREVAKHFRLGGKSEPSGHGVVLLVNLLAPVDAKATEQVISRMPLLMWDLSVRDLAYVVNKCVNHDISCDLQSTRRMAMKASALRERMSVDDLLTFLRAFVKWEFRDVDTFNLLALEVMSRNPGNEAVQKEIASSFQTLSIIPPQEVERLMSR